MAKKQPLTTTVDEDASTAMVPVETLAMTTAQATDDDDGFGAMSPSDILTPRLVLVQATSSQVVEHGVRPGSFFVDGLGVALAEPPIVTVLAKRRIYILWNPDRAASTSILAVCDDGISWDKPRAEFTVQPKGAPGPVVWRTKGSLAASGLAAWGSSIPGMSKSRPAAAETHEYLVHIHHDDVAIPAILSLSRTGVKAAKALNTLLMATREPRSVRIKLTARRDTSGQGDSYFGISVQPAGRNTPEEIEALRERARLFLPMLRSRQPAVEHEDVADAIDGAATTIDDDTIPF